MNGKTGLAFGCVALAATILGRVDAGVSDREWSRIRREFSGRYRNDATRLEAVRSLGEANDRRAVRLLFSILRSGVATDEVKRAVLDALGKTTDHKAIEELVLGVSRVGDWQTRTELLGVLGRLGGARVEQALLGSLKSGDPRTKSAAIDALGHIKSKAAIAPIVKELQRNPHWQVREAAIYALARIRDPRCLEPLFAALARETGRLRGDVEKALHALTGKRLGRNPALWRSWWSGNRDKPLAGPGLPRVEKGDLRGGFAGMLGRAFGPGRRRAGPEEKGGTKVPTYYGIEILSKRMVFIIDISGSMSAPLERKPALDPRPVITGGRPPAGLPQNLDWSQVKTKLDLAKHQLIHAITALPRNASFNIVFYNQQVTSWKKGLLPATWENKDAAIRKVKSLQPSGLTNIYEALEKGFDIHGSSPAQVYTNYRAGADTLFFMTDGFPTAGKITDRNGIVQAVDKWNQVRRIKINTIGIGTHDAELMKQLASRNKGVYKAP